MKKIIQYAKNQFIFEVFKLVYKIIIKNKNNYQSENDENVSCISKIALAKNISDVKIAVSIKLAQFT